MNDRIKLFNIMRCDFDTMSQYGDDESALYNELMTADNDIIDAYMIVFCEEQGKEK